MNKLIAAYVRRCLTVFLFFSASVQAESGICIRVMCELAKLKDRLALVEGCALPITGPTTISSSGSYCLSNDFSVASGTGITISASDVDLDLAGKTITGTGGDTGVKVTSGSDSVTIKNGTITAMNKHGVLLDTSTNCVVTDCKVIDTSGTNSVYGFRSEGGSGNSFEHCVVRDLVTTSTIVDEVAVGFAFNVDEADSLIIDSRVCNVQTNTTGPRPFGIRLEYDDDQLLTDTLANFEHDTTVREVNWSPDGRYLVICGDTNGSSLEVQVLEFTGTSLSTVATFDHGAPVREVKWSPDGRYLAIGGNTSGGIEVRVLAFDGSSLTSVATFAHTASVCSVNWSPDGRYLAIGGTTNGSSLEVQVLTFTGASLSTVATFDHGDRVLSVDWSPDGRHLAIGGFTDPGDSLEVRVLEFTGTALTEVATFDHGIEVRTVDWSPDGRYVATGADNAGDIEVKVLEFDDSPASLTLVATFLHDNDVREVKWSSDGRFLLIGGKTNAGSLEIQVLAFDGITSPLPVVATFDHGGSEVTSVDWSPGGEFIAIGGVGGTGGFDVRVLEGLRVPQDCVIKNCVAKKINGFDVVFSDGVGISASSDANVITDNAVVESDQPYNFLVSQFTENSLFNFAPFGNRIFP